MQKSGRVVAASVSVAFLVTTTVGVVPLAFIEASAPTQITTQAAFGPSTVHSLIAKVSSTTSHPTTTVPTTTPVPTTTVEPTPEPIPTTKPIPTKPVVPAAPEPVVAAPAPQPEPIVGVIETVIAFAKAQLGDDYVYGANGPDTWDCSSLMQASYRAAGITIPRTTYGQVYAGYSVTRADVRAGDLIIYYADNGHVAMALDNGNAIHAPTSGDVVKISPINAIGPISSIRRIVD